MRKIRVIIKEPGCKPRSVWISDSLENLQKHVGGYIEINHIATDLVLICDEEGRLKDKPFCAKICGWNFVGTIILAGSKGEELADIPVTMAELREAFPNLWEGIKE